MSIRSQLSYCSNPEVKHYSQALYPNDMEIIVSDDSHDLKGDGSTENPFLATPSKLSDPMLANLIDIEIPSTKSTTNRKRDCLKFCRGLSYIVLRHLIEKSKFIQRLVRLNAEALETLIPLLDLASVSIYELEILQFQVLLQIWSDFKELLSYRRNKKICLVTQEYWDLVFDKTTCVDACQKIFCSFKETTKSSAMEMLLKDEAFTTILAKLLYCTSKIFALIATLKDNSERGMDIRNLETIDNFIVLMIYPNYFGLYNHRAGKFASECCNKCKICCGKKVPWDFQNILGGSRIRTRQLIKELTDIIENYSSNDSGAFASILELAINIC